MSEPGGSWTRRSARAPLGAIVRRVARVALAGASTLLVGVASADHMRLPSDTTVAHVAGSPYVADGPTKVAASLGLFDGEPAIVVQRYASGQHALEGLLAGEVGFALVAPTPLTLAVLERSHRSTYPSDPVVIASIALSSQSHQIVADAGAGVRELTDLAGRRLGLPIGTSAHFTWARLAATLALDPPPTLVDVHVQAHAAALASGTVDAVVTWEPHASALLTQGHDELVRISTRQAHAVNWLLVTHRDTVDRRPELVERVLRAYLGATAAIDRDPVASARVRAEALGVDPDDLAALEAGVLWDVTIDWSVLANVAEQVRWWAVAITGTDDAAEVLSPSRYLAPEPLRAIAPERVRVPHYLYEPRVSEARP